VIWQKWAMVVESFKGLDRNHTSNLRRDGLGTAPTLNMVFSACLTHLLCGQVSNKGDLIKLVVVGFVHQENPVGQDGQRDY